MSFADTLLELDTACDIKFGDEDMAFGTGGAPVGPDEQPTDDPLSEDDVWRVIESFFRAKGLVHHQVDSFNHFLANIPRLVRSLKDVTPSQESQYDPGAPQNEHNKQLVFRFEDVRLGKPSDEGSLFGGGGGSAVPTYPNQCRLRDTTYAAEAQVSVSMTQYEVNPEDGSLKEADGSEPRSFTTRLGRIPIMLRSMICHLQHADEDQLPFYNECPHDQGGYFIISGTEKVLIAQERQAANKVYTFNTKSGWVSEIKSMVDGIMLRPRTFKVVVSEKASVVQAFEVRVAQMSEMVPLFVLYRALGMLSDREIIHTIIPDVDDAKAMNVLRPAIEIASTIHTQDDALHYIGSRMGEVNERAELINKARFMISNDLLPHMGAEPGTERRKCFFIGYMVQKLLRCYLGRAEETDRDFLGNKRQDMAGALIMNQFNNYLVQMHKEMTAQLTEAHKTQRATVSLRDLVRHDIITNGMRGCLATGNFGTADKITSGISQTLNRLTYSSSLSNLRRIQNPIDSSSKVTRPRNLHSSTWGYICPVETPEGGSIGLLKNMSLMCMISVGTPHQDLLQMVEARGVRPFAQLHHRDITRARTCKVFVNGALIGVHDNPEGLLRQLRARRRDGSLGNEVGIVRDIRDGELRMWSDAGRAIRPLFVVENGQVLMRKRHLPAVSDTDLRSRQMASSGLVGVTHTIADAQVASGTGIVADVQSAINWNKIMRAGVVELIDCEEEDSLLIALRPKDVVEKKKQYSHSELDPAMMFGICASIIPFPNHNQSPRNTYQSAMGKQAMGIYAKNFKVRMDTTCHVLYYPQKPLVRTKLMSFLHSNDLPAGHNALVAIMCYSGYNQEDSVVLNKSAVDRGFFRSVFWRSYKAEEVKEGRKSERFEKPERAVTSRMKQADYNKLDHDGLILPGTRLEGGDVLVGKTSKKPPMDLEALQLNQNDADAAKTKDDASICARTNEKGVVEAVMLTVRDSRKTGEPCLFAKVKIRICKIPKVGDKFCSRHGQKGTCGIQFRAEDLPFNRDGVVPDLVMNPHAVPSRMTIAHLIETLAGKIGCYAGKELDATPFSEIRVQEIASILHKLGYQRWGYEQLYNGHTGLPLDSLVYFGPTYYQRLKHLSGDKIHARPRGPLQNLVRQPTHGRAHEGGLRFGEMERDCMLSAGSSAWLRERLFICSDLYAVHVCKGCGMICAADMNQHHYFCKGCNSSTNVARVLLPYACKLLFQELMAMQILPRVATGPL